MGEGPAQSVPASPGAKEWLKGDSGLRSGAKD